MWGNDKSAAENLTDYISDVSTLISHLDAARQVAVGFYNHNPDSRNVPGFDSLYDDLQAICLELHAAKETAKARLQEL